MASNFIEQSLHFCTKYWVFKPKLLHHHHIYQSQTSVLVDYKNCFENSVLISLRIIPDELIVHIIYSKISEAQNRQRRERQNSVPKISPWMASQQNVTACVVLICGLYHKLHYNLVQDMDGLLHLNNRLLLPLKKNQYKIRFVSFNAAWQQYHLMHIWYILGGTICDY